MIFAGRDLTGRLGRLKILEGAALARAIFAALCLGLTLGAAPALAETGAPPTMAPQGSEQAAPDQAGSSAPAVVPGPDHAAASAPEPLAAPEPARAAVAAAETKHSALPLDLTPWGMFSNAVLTVKIVMIGLAIASLVTWTVWLAKSIELYSAKRAAARDLDLLAKAATLRAAQQEFGPSRTPVALLVSAAVGEAARSRRLHPEGVKERAAALLSRVEARAGRMMTRGTGALATIGSTAPFVGLFGTVWGIMDSFIGISKSHTTNLAIVAPGIAEALLATAMGLVAAIPAVVIYNMFARAIAGYRAQLGDASAEVLCHLSRDLDRDFADLDAGDGRVVPLRQSAE